jgi:glycosyltransferase involved in cell wall biosynthesis
LVRAGHYVEWFSAAFPGSAAEEELDGIRIVRAGRQSTVHWLAFRKYRDKLRGHFDAVIDEVNTMPFFTPLWADIPRFMFIHQLARKVWWYESRFPLNAIGFVVEPWYLRLYRRTPVLTVSSSTEADLRNLGFRGPIAVVPEGLEPIRVQHVTKKRIPTLLYVGRLAPSKRVTHILRAFATFRSACGPSQLWLIGDGPDDYVRRLHRLVRHLGLSGCVRFWGRLPPHEKHLRMAEAHMLLMASVREGWGLVVTEANACGTPAIVYDVHGLRDAVRDEETGLVVPPSPRQLARAMTRLWSDQSLYERLGAEARRWSQSFSYEATVDAVTKGLTQTSWATHGARSDGATQAVAAVKS